ncbi:MAG: carbohydrate kinase [Williamsia sp.]|nr:carbohydrate kinase [Williamsia sp.]
MSSTYPVVCFGEVLWEVLPDKFISGGASVNGAFHLKKLGINPALITKIGMDKAGKELVNLLAAHGLTTDYFQADCDHPTGKLHTQTNEYDEALFDIAFPSAWDFIHWEDAFARLVSCAEFFVFGSLITRCQQSRETLYRLIETARVKVLDINLHAPYFNRRIVEELFGKINILKLNLAELELITGWFSHFTDETDRIKLLQDRFCIETVIVTKGSKGAVLNTGAACFRHNGYRIEVADATGSSDAFLAGFLSKLIDRSPPESALEYACAAGALVASYPGACPDYRPDEIIRLMHTNQATTI